MSKYYVLLEQSVDANGNTVFFQQFGDVSKNCVESERLDFARCTGIPLKSLHILTVEHPAIVDPAELNVDAAVEQFRLNFIKHQEA